MRTTLFTLILAAFVSTAKAEKFWAMPPVGGVPFTLANRAQLDVAVNRGWVVFVQPDCPAPRRPRATTPLAPPMSSAARAAASGVAVGGGTYEPPLYRPTIYLNPFCKQL
jgi:hypothetical protein